MLAFLEIHSPSVSRDITFRGDTNKYCSLRKMKNWDLTSLALRALGIVLLIAATKFGFEASREYNSAHLYRDYKSLTVASSEPIPPEKAASNPESRRKQELYNHQSSRAFSNLIWLILLAPIGTYLVCGGRFRNTRAFDGTIRILGLLLGIFMIAGGIWSATAFEEYSVFAIGSIIWLLFLGAALTLPPRVFLWRLVLLRLYYALGIFSLCYLFVSGIRVAVQPESAIEAFGLVGICLAAFLIVGFHMLSTKSAANNQHRDNPLPAAEFR